MRERHHVDLGLADHRRVAAQITLGDDDYTTRRLVEALRDLTAHLDDLPPAPEVRVPAPGELELEQVMLPREAFFGPADHVPADDAVGRIAAETVSPYPPGVPAVLPGEVITQPVVDYLRSGVAAGMLLPDASDGKLDTLRVVAES